MDIVKTLLDVAATFVTPDWGALVQLIPIGLALVVVLYLLWTVRRFATAGPTRRAPARLTPVPPPTVHMPGGSAAPIVVAFGAFSVLAGMVIGGVGLIVGVVVLVLTLLAWGREALRDYQHLEPVPALPAVIREPPPGIHMPGPSIRPLMAALGATALLGGLVLGGWVLALGVVFLVYTLLGWLVDFTAEYRKVEEADRTGHLENIPSRRLPTITIGVFGIAFVLIALIQAGIFPPQVGTAGAPGASGGSAAPAASLPPNTFAVVAKDVAFDKHAISVAANQDFHIQFSNQDNGVEHDVDIRDSSGKTIQDEPHTSGGQSQTYDYKALPAGTYTFICSVHPIPQMTGTLTVGP